jgi:adenine deaminase
MAQILEIKANYVDIFNQKTYPALVQVVEGKISQVLSLPGPCDGYILPGFVDAHVHIESSMLVPTEFARLAVVHGTVATVSDPHEIANVLGLDGVRFMLQNAGQTPFKFAFGAPSCVPATTFETAGAAISPAEIAQLFAEEGIKYLAEMMNWPGVLYHDQMVYEKIGIAQRFGRPIDGHAPGLRGEQARAYASAGISTDHECFARDEALDKLACGMKILVREGSAAKNFDALVGLLPQHWAQMMFCSDDKHPDSLVDGHLDQLARRAVRAGVDVYQVLRVACANPVAHYGLPVGLLRPGDPADFIVVDDLRDFRVRQTWIGGLLVAEEGRSLLPPVPVVPVNRFRARPVAGADFQVRAAGPRLRAIEALDGELITRQVLVPATVADGLAVADPSRDLLKLAVVNRYAPAPPAVAFIRNFGLRAGALASSVAHDSHNIVAVGCDDDALARAVNLVIGAQGGIAACHGPDERVLPLPVAGLMSAADGYQVARDYSALDQMAKAMGSGLRSPFMTLSFMALLVIPALKLSDLGLFDGEKFSFVDLFAE